jgi:hypothetical protein
MTSARRCGKSFTIVPAALLVALACGSIGMMARAATTERVVTNALTGLAIEGFDPVAYFIDQAPQLGRPDFEFRYREVIWRFRNSGNLAAFVDAPGDFEPRFGGYDPVAIARGSPTPGNPQIWLIVGEKLYLFYDPRTRDEFNADPRRIAAQAEARWPSVVKNVLSQ